MKTYKKLKNVDIRKTCMYNNILSGKKLLYMHH